MTTTDLPRTTTSAAVSAAFAPAAIATRGLTKTFGTVEAVRGLDLTIEQGEVVALLGPNGAGKTTTIDMVLGLARPTSGAVEVFGLEPHEAVRRGLVAAVMQTAGLLKDLTVAESVSYVASLFARPASVAEVLQTAGITEIANRRVGKCSGGEQQRVRYAMALVSDPELIVLDEPTTGMDVQSRRAFWENIHADAEQGRTVVFATHYLEEADTWADRIVVIRDGEVVADGTPAQIKAMSTGRTIRCSWPDADRELLASLPGVDGVEIRHDTVLLRSRSSDEVTRALLNRTPAHDIEITAHGLEDAFVALTSR